jgi:hypothetical protein
MGFKLIPPIGSAYFYYYFISIISILSILSILSFPALLAERTTNPTRTPLAVISPSPGFAARIERSTPNSGVTSFSLVTHRCFGTGNFPIALGNCPIDAIQAA